MNLSEHDDMHRLNLFSPANNWEKGTFLDDLRMEDEMIPCGYADLILIGPELGDVYHLVWAH